MAMPSETDVQPYLAPTPAVPPGVLRSSKLGEELAIFCERCGYSLNGLPMSRCADCKILHFHCPECGHHQPINTLRPAAQRVLGRLRGLWLCLSIFFKLNFFGWLLFAWGAMGMEWSHTWHFQGNRTMVVNAGGVTRMVPQHTRGPRPLDWEALLAFSVFGLGFGLFGRMLLLRWRRGYLVGITLALLVMVAVYLGTRAQQFDMDSIVPLYTRDMFILSVIGAGMVVIGAWISWPIWVLLARLFLPTRTAGALLEWQRSLSHPVQKLAQE
jgi:hypothetical protein